MYTSGTTAAPKPVALSYGNWLWNALGSAMALGLDPDERWLCPMPLAPRRRPVDPDPLGDLRHHRPPARALRHRPRCWPTLMDPGQRSRWCRWCRRCSRGCSTPVCASRRRCAGRCSAAARSRPALLERARAAGVAVAPSYGMTEACSQIATDGFPLLGVELRLADDDSRDARARRPVVAPAALGARRLAAHRRPGRVRRARPAGDRGPQGRHDRLAAARTSRRPRSRRCCWSTRRSLDAAVFGRPTPSGVRPCRPRGRVVDGVPRSRPSSCRRTALRGWRRSRCPSGSSTSAACRGRRPESSCAASCADPLGAQRRLLDARRRSGQIAVHDRSNLCSLATDIGPRIIRAHQR